LYQPKEWPMNIMLKISNNRFFTLSAAMHGCEE